MRGYSQGVEVRGGRCRVAGVGWKWSVGCGQCGWEMGGGGTGGALRGGWVKGA